MPRPAPDLIGRRFGRWTVLARVPGPRRSRWRCRCDCGTETDVDASSLTSGQSASCGCARLEYLKTRALPAGFAKSPSNLAGRRFGRLVAVAHVPARRPARARWRCLCDCGAETVVETSNLTKGNTTSCGCRKVETGAALGAASSERKWPRFCRRCGRDFLGVSKQWFCCAHCASRYHAELKWPKTAKKCKHCGAAFLGRAERQYCSLTCLRRYNHRARYLREHDTFAEQARSLETRLTTILEANPNGGDQD